MELTRAFVAGATGGRSAGFADPEPVGHGIAFDSRALSAGQVFVALRGTRDGHEFVGDAHDRGAAFSIVEQGAAGIPAAEIPVVEVSDTATALGALTVAARSLLRIPVVAITGSVGKTSTKDLAAAALRAGFRTHAAPASYNNEIGVPATVLGAPHGTEVLVLELGARFAGNIAELCAITRPTVGVITNIGNAHAEHLGGLEGVAAVKGELLEALPATGLAVISTDASSAKQRSRSVAPVLTVGTTPDADVRASDVMLDPELHVRFQLDTPWGSGVAMLGVRGAHQVINAAQAATVALHLGVPFDSVLDALSRAPASAWRMQVELSAAGIHVINDAYNASPVSTLAALDAFVALPVTGRRIAVLGEMAELGDLSASEHTRVGFALAERGIDLLVAVGAPTEPLAVAAEKGGVRVVRVDDGDVALATVLAEAQPGDGVLVKASRVVGLERVALALVGAEVIA